jgi:LysM repeat protein
MAICATTPRPTPFQFLRPAAALLLLGAFVVAASPAPIRAQSLRGSSVSLDLQNQVAHQHDYTYIETAERVRFFASKGWLVRVRPNDDFTLHAVSFPYARPEVEVFIKRLAGQYHEACGEQLVVTSLTRPTTRQPSNASERSVHPTGMALDVRYSRDASCRKWLEEVLLELERARLLEATLERHPVHYHIALYPSQYASYVDRLQTQATDERYAAAEQIEEAEQLEAEVAYTVRSGDSLWGIARAHGTTVDALQEVNGLSNSQIYAGQVIDLPNQGG